MDSTTNNQGHGEQPKYKPPTWRPLLHLYRPKELRSMTFADDAGMDAAIDLLWADELFGMPWDIAAGDSLIVPAEAVAFFKAAGLEFLENELLNPAELTAEELAELRRQ